ncbi:TrfB-related DNA-binding protein [Pseudomonas caricapapayae]|nr:TrfB-related DNA-binding protein [Pseudomonas caricapapayae]
MTAPDDVVAATASQIQRTFAPGQIAQLIRLISPASPCALMSPEAFEHVVAFMSCKTGQRAFSAKSLHAARLVLVMGASVAEAAADVGLARQVVHRLMMRIRARLQQLPGEWVKVEAWLPPAAARQVADLAAELRLAHQAVGEKAYR